jgi:hypothetical protein
MGSITTRPPGHRRRILAGEIVQTLTLLGGAAHRDLVCETIAVARRRAGRVLPKKLRADLVNAFAAYCDLNPERCGGEAALFTLPFGPQSLRWALADAASPPWAGLQPAGRLSA